MPLPSSSQGPDATRGSSPSNTGEYLKGQTVEWLDKKADRWIPAIVRQVTFLHSLARSLTHSLTYQLTRALKQPTNSKTHRPMPV